MKRFSFLCIAMLSAAVVYSQSQTLKGTILPNIKGGNLILPNSSTTPNSVSSQSNNIVLVGGSMDPTKGGNVILQKNNKPNYATDPQIVPLTSGSYEGAAGPILFQAPPSKRKVNSVTTDPQKVATTTSNSLGSLTDNSFGSLTDDYNRGSTTGSNTSSTNNQNSSNSQLAPLTDNPQKVTVATISNSKSLETVDPSLMNQNKGTTKTNNQSTNNSSAAYNYSTPKLKMPPLALIDGKSIVSSNSKSSMAELAPIDGQPTQSTNKSGMPELAPLEGEAKQGESKSAMPELAAIEDENSAAAQQQTQQISTPKVKTNLRGFRMPTGTTLSSKNNRSFIFKPAVPVVEEEPAKKENIDDANNYKPSAGGGIGIPALAPIEIENKRAEAIPELAPIENSSRVNNIEAMPMLAKIPVTSRIEYQPNVSRQRYQYKTSVQPPVTTNQTKEQLLQAAKKHQHDPNNPCCKVQMYKPPTTTKAKKTTYKKPAYRRPRTVYQQPQIETEETEIVYVYQEPQQQQQRQTTERIVYVPVQPQQQKQQTYQAPQPVYQSQPVQQQKQKVVYRDYTNTYNKETSTYNNNCNCPGTTQQSKAAVNKDGKKYYNPSNYANGLNAGPTSGDYPTSSSSSEVDMRYSFYLTPRGKYSVGLYNDYCSILLSQNGQVVEYKINADPSLDPKSYKPRLNYFGSPENVAGIPIEYNYNRSVHKIGNIKFDYDFEGFFKTVNTSNVLYTSRSSLQKVDDINVYYDQSGNVTSVDPNNGLIQFNPN